MTYDFRERLYALACAALFVFGMVLALPGTVLGVPEVVAGFGLSLAERGQLIASLFLGLLIGSLVSGPIIDALGPRAGLTGSAALVAACLPVFAAAGDALTAAASLAALGVAGAGMNTAANALSSDLFPDQRARRMNGIAIAVGCGGLALPVAAAVTAGVVSWRATVLAGALLAALVAGVGARLPAPPRVRGAGALTPAAFLHLVRRPGVAWFCALVLLGGGNEASMAGWTSTFVTASGFSPAAATWILSSHWLGLILGRAAFSGRIERAKAEAIRRSALCAAAVLTILVAASGPIVAVLPFAAGVAMALVVPTSLALAGERYPGSAGTLFGTLLTFAQIGGMALPAAVGFVAERTTLRWGMAVLVSTHLAVAAVASRAARVRLC